MSDFTSEFWSWYVAGLTLVSILACAVLLWISGTTKVKARADNTTGHVWDGDLQEMNNPLPRWWVYLFIITVIFALVYGVLYPTFGKYAGVLGWSSQGQHQAEVDKMQQDIAPIYARFNGLSPEQLAGDAPAMAVGERLYMNNCAQCHGSDARGARSFPNLTDGDWLHGGEPGRDQDHAHAGPHRHDAAAGRCRGHTGRRAQRGALRAEPVGHAARLGARGAGPGQVRRVRRLPRRRRQGQHGAGRAQPDRRHLAARLGRRGHRARRHQRHHQPDAGAGRQAQRRPDPCADRLCLGPVQQATRGAPTEPDCSTPVSTTKPSATVIPIVPAAVDDETMVSLYAASQKIHPRSVSGVFSNWRWLMVWITQIVFYGLPWLEWNARQAVLFDLEARRFYIFSLVLYPQDFIYLTGLLVISALSLFLFTAVAGRLWCGFACPQTVYTEIFLWIEKKVEGDRSARLRLDAATMSASKLGKRVLKQVLWIAFALWTGFTFVGYFTPIRELAALSLAASLGPWQTFWVFFYGFATYGNAGFLREQVCKYMCPYARFQSAMFDKDTMIVTYDEKRGEPRGPRSKKADPVALGLGSCIDCTLCVQVCPTGIDIRKGLQYECIGCAACVDVCDDVMDKVGYPRGLIKFSTQNGMAAGLGHATDAQARHAPARAGVLGHPAHHHRGGGREPVPAHAAARGRDARPRFAGAHGGAGPHRKRVPPADHERHRGDAALCHQRLGPARHHAGSGHRGRGVAHRGALGRGAGADSARHRSPRAHTRSSSRSVPPATRWPA